MVQCPCCGKMFEGERGASVHLHYCPKSSNFQVHGKAQTRQRKKEAKEGFEKGNWGLNGFRPL